MTPTFIEGKAYVLLSYEAVAIEVEIIEESCDEVLSGIDEFFKV